MRPILLIAYLAVLAFFAPARTVPAVAPATGQGRIAYVSGGNIWTIDPDGTRKRQLTDSGRDTSPSWSRDGRNLAFVRSAAEGRFSGDVYVINADGGPARLIVTGPCWSPLWSPAADELAFLRPSQADEADGNYIAFVDARGKPTANAILLPESRAVHAPSLRELCDWSPDGTLLSFFRVGYIYYDIEVFAREKGKLTRHSLHEHSNDRETYVRKDYVFHGWSRGDPSGILLVEHQSRFTRGTGDPFTGTLLVAAPDGTMRRPIVTWERRGERADRATWSPDGKQIAYESAGKIWVTRIDNPQPRSLVEGSHPRWSRR